MKKHQVNIRLEDAAYKALAQIASQEATDKCPCCKQKWKPPSEYQGEAIATVAAKLLVEIIQQKIKPVKEEAR